MLCPSLFLGRVAWKSGEKMLKSRQGRCYSKVRVKGWLDYLCNIPTLLRLLFMSDSIIFSFLSEVLLGCTSWWFKEVKVIIWSFSFNHSGRPWSPRVYHQALRVRMSCRAWVIVSRSIMFPNFHYVDPMPTWFHLEDTTIVTLNRSRARSAKRRLYL